MSPPKTVRWALDPHTKAKHLILRRYLEAWLPIMSTHNERIVFVDGFAGPGRYEGNEEGSPLIALKALLNHPNFKTPKDRRKVTLFFTERDEKRCKALKEEIDAITVPGWVTVQAVQNEFEPAMTELLDALDRKGHRLAPTFAFIDPFGFSGAPMELVKRILSNPRCECLISFMFESINRFIAHSDSAIQAHFDDLFGTTEWRELLKIRSGDARRNAIVELYRNQLLRSGAGYVRTFEMIDSGNKTEYFLYFATQKKIGLSKMKEAMWRTDPTGGQQFSDRTVSDQMVLLEATVDVETLQSMLFGRFHGRGWVTIEEIEDFVLVDTPFSERIHLKRASLKPLEKDDLIEVRRPVGARKVPGQYPPGTKIKFG